MNLGKDTFHGQFYYTYICWKSWEQLIWYMYLAQTWTKVGHGIDCWPNGVSLLEISRKVHSMLMFIGSANRLMVYCHQHSIFICLWWVPRLPNQSWCFLLWPIICMFRCISRLIHARRIDQRDAFNLVKDPLLHHAISSASSFWIDVHWVYPPSPRRLIPSYHKASGQHWPNSMFTWFLLTSSTKIELVSAFGLQSFLFATVFSFTTPPTIFRDWLIG